MPLPTIADTYQCTLVWTNSALSRQATNTIHVKDLAGTNGPADVYAKILAHVTSGMWTCVSSNAAIGQVSVTKLDGTSAEQIFNPVAAAKWTGQGSSEAIPQGAFVVSFKSLRRGPRGRNRVFLPYVGEGQTANGSIDPTATTNTVTAWSTFCNAMDTDSFPVVITSYVHSAEEALFSVSGVGLLRTQRRRARH